MLKNEIKRIASYRVTYVGKTTAVTTDMYTVHLSEALLRILFYDVGWIYHSSIYE